MTNEAEAATGTGRMSLRSLTMTLLGITLVAFHLYTAGFGQFPPLVQRSIHVGLGLCLTYLQFFDSMRPEGGRLRRLAILFNATAALFAVVASFYITANDERLTTGFGVVAQPHEIFLGIGLTAILLEAARRTTGPFLPGLALLLIAYTLFGNLIPGDWGHPGFAGIYLLEHLYIGAEGIWGTVTGLSANLIAIFIIFGAFLLATGAAEVFMNVAIAAAGRSKGGAAKVATVASALFGMLNGAAVANVATTGNFTIPAMKRLGYRPAFAAAVEATASSGGQITPPIMGAGAFVMAELLGVSYLDVAFAAAIPALLFYTCIWFSIDIEARREDMRAFDESEVPSWREVLNWREVVPLGLTIFVTLFSMFLGHTPSLAAFYGICTNVVLYILTSGFSRAALKERFGRLLRGVEMGASGIVSILALLVSAQIALSLIGLTGIGIKLSEQILAVGSSGGFLVGLVLTLGVALVLGMGMPTTAAYLVAAAVTVPTLTELGVPALNAHFFVFYSALLSALTPPVCTAVFTAAVIARIHWWPVAVNSIRLAMMKYILPFFFVYRPEVLLAGKPWDILWSVVIGMAAAMLFAIGFGGFYLSRIGWPLRVVVLAAAVGLVADHWPLDVFGIATLCAVVVWQRGQALRASAAHAAETQNQ